MQYILENIWNNTLTESFKSYYILESVKGFCYGNEDSALALRCCEVSYQYISWHNCLQRISSIFVGKNKLMQPNSTERSLISFPQTEYCFRNKFESWFQGRQLGYPCVDKISHTDTARGFVSSVLYLKRSLIIDQTSRFRCEELIASFLNYILPGRRNYCCSISMSLGWKSWKHYVCDWELMRIWIKFRWILQLLWHALAIFLQIPFL